MSLRPGKPRSSQRKLAEIRRQQVVNGFVEGGKCLYWLHTHGATGHVTVFLNGKRFTGDPRSVKLTRTRSSGSTSARSSPAGLHVPSRALTSAVLDPVGGPPLTSAALGLA